MFLVSSCPRIVLFFFPILYNATEPGWNWLSHVGSLDSDPLGNVAPHCRHLQCIRWTGPQGVFGLGGIHYLTVGINFRNFYIDDVSRLAAHLKRPLFYKRTGFVSFGSYLSKVCNGWAFEMSLATTEMIPVPLLNHCHRTSCVSKWCVRRHATLRWLRSDLWEDNVIVMLQRESNQTLLLLGIRCC
jgi:hypothetical protein